jgi:hypothetical protein
MIVSQEAHRHFLVFFLRCRRTWQASRLVVISWFFSSNVENDNELGGSHLVVIFWVFPPSASSLGSSPPDASLLYLHVCGIRPPPSYHTTPLHLYPKLLHKTQISLRVVNIHKNWVIDLLSIKEIPHCCYNSKFVSLDLEDLRLSIDLYTSIPTIIRIFV